MINIARQDLQTCAFQRPSAMDLDPLKVSVRLTERPLTIRGQFIRGRGGRCSSSRRRWVRGVD
jgi:hypothetical protein